MKKTDKINICFSIIPSRFKNIEKLVESFKLQTLNPDKIIITVPKNYHRFSYFTLMRIMDLQLKFMEH